MDDGSDTIAISTLIRFIEDSSRVVKGSANSMFNLMNETLDQCALCDNDKHAVYVNILMNPTMAGNFDIGAKLEKWISKDRWSMNDFSLRAHLLNNYHSYWKLKEITCLRLLV